MALTGIAIFKMLPKTNCGECGFSTCLAFAMNLAAGKAALAACPHVSAEAKSQLTEASAPPIRTVTIGTGDRAVRLGGETVLFRHEKKFENPPGLALLISDAMPDTEIQERLSRFARLRYERVGIALFPELVAVRAEANDAVKFRAVVEQVRSRVSCALILMSESAALLAAALEICREDRPLLYAATRANIQEMAALAQTAGCPLAVKGEDLEDTAALAAGLIDRGLTDLVLDSGARTLRQALADQVMSRRAALSKKFPALGFPTIVFPGEMASDLMQETLLATVFMAKYGSLIVLSDFQGHSLFPLLVARMDIFSDPQRPLATTAGIYPINNPHENSPVIVTANFSLTYFIVSGEVESSRVPCWLLIKDTEGLSLLTAWSAGKFSGEQIAQWVQQCGLAEKVTHRKIILPGHVAMESGSLEEALPGWEVLVGPREASYLPAYLKSWQG
jgi:acetyl-CoA decarbonylase/synthase complex subunit gamma